MSVFNYRTKKETLEGLSDRVMRLEKVLKNLRFWEVNDASQGPNVLKRRRITPSITLGVVGKGNWNNVDSGGGGESFDWTICSLGFECDPNGNDHDLVRIYAGEIDRIAVAQTDVTVANNDYVYVRRTISNNTMFVTNAASVPADDTTYKYYRLYRFSVSAKGVASIKNIYRPFDIESLPVKTVIYDVRFDTATLQLQKKTINIFSGDISDWSTIEGGQAESCP